MRGILGRNGPLIQAQWNAEWLPNNITLKEIPIVLAIAMWGKYCCHKYVLAYCDNMAVVQIMVSKTSKEPGMMHLFRCLHFCTTMFDINVKVVHLAGKLNVIG
jgi:hypothetical protein